MKKVNVLLLSFSLLLFVYLSYCVMRNTELSFDTYIFSIVENISMVHFKVFYYITMAGSPLLVFLLALTIGFNLLFIKKDLNSALLIMISPLVGSLLNRSLKYVFKRDRPFIDELVEGTGYSFPSGHSTASIIFYGCCIYLIARSGWRQSVKWLYYSLFVVLILFIGVSRIYFHVHYPTDVLGGYAFGFVCLMLSIIVYEKSIKSK